MEKTQKQVKKRRAKRYIFGLDLGVFISIAIGVLALPGTVYTIASYYKPDTIEVATQEPDLPAMVVDDTPFNEWIKSDQQYNNLIYESGTISLSEAGYKRQYLDILSGGPVHDPQGYMQSPQSISENVFICTKILSKTDEIDYSLRLNYKFQVIFGDGDNRSIALKQLNSENPNWDYIIPDSGIEDPHVDDLNRFRLDVPLPTDKEFVSCLTIHSPQGESSKNISVELSFLDNEGHKMDVGPTPSWTLVDTRRINGDTNNYFSVGLIDSRRAYPELELTGYCAVEMNDLGNEPSPRERAKCENP